MAKKGPAMAYNSIQAGLRYGNPMSG